MFDTPPPGPVIRIAANGGDAGQVASEASCGIPCYSVLPIKPANQPAHSGPDDEAVNHLPRREKRP